MSAILIDAHRELVTSVITLENVWRQHKAFGQFYFLGKINHRKSVVKKR